MYMRDMQIYIPEDIDRYALRAMPKVYIYIPGMYISCPSYMCVYFVHCYHMVFYVSLSIYV